jgi:multidrug efflux system outer membrane protein
MRAAFLAILLAGCAVGPGYHPQPAVPAGTQVGAGHRSDSAGAFVDSLAAARAADTAVAVTRLPAPRLIAADSLADLAWLDILRDSALTRLVTTALKQNRDLALAEARVREFRALAGVAEAPLFPSVTANAGATRAQLIIGDFPAVNYTAWSVTGNVAWELDLWGRIRKGWQAAKADVAASDAAAQAAVLSLVSDVASGYLTLLELDQEREISERTFMSRNASLRLARQRYARGVISELDVRQFEAQAAVPAAVLAEVERRRAVQEHALSVLIGQAPVAIPRGGSLAAAARGVIVPDSLPATLIARRPDVRVADRNYAAATARVGAAIASRLPTFTITGSGGTQAGNTDNLFGPGTDIYQIQAGISLPLFTGGRLVNQQRAASARAEQARAAYEQAVLTALREAGDALAGARSARDQVIAQETQTSALRRALTLARARYQTGVASYLEVLDAERSLYVAELALSQAQLGQVTAAVQLYKALGGSWPGAMPGH